MGCTTNPVHSTPVSLTHILQSTRVSVRNSLGVTAFSAAETGASFINLTALSTGSGVCSALDSLATEEHGKTKNSTGIGCLLLRAVF